MVTPEMVEIWQHRQLRQGSAQRHGVGLRQGRLKVTDAVIVRNAAKLEGERLTFDVAVLEGSLGNADGPASVFIDTIWFGVGSNGFTYYGQSQTTGGMTPNIGDPHGTSTFTGWSNPSPTRPYVPPATELRHRRAGAPPPPDIDPRYQQRYNQPTCGKPPLLPCY